MPVASPQPMPQVVELERGGAAEEGQEDSGHAQPQDRQASGHGQVQTDENADQKEEQRPQQHLPGSKDSLLYSPASPAKGSQFAVHLIVARKMVKVVVAHIQAGIDADDADERQQEIAPVKEALTPGNRRTHED